MGKKRKKKLTEADLKDRAAAMERSVRFEALLEKAQAEIDAKKGASSA
jgi:hypothetical protein